MEYKMVRIVDKYRMMRLLDTFNSNDLMGGFIWSSSSQKFPYWENLYSVIHYKIPVSPERIEEARGHIRKMLGIIDPTKEAEWE